MYEGETFSQMFKRTKKCCAKLLRKISFNTSTPSHTSIRLGGGNQITKYTQQKDRPDHIDCSPKSSFPNNWNQSFSSSNNNNNSCKNVINSRSFPTDDDISRDEDECQQQTTTFRISPKLFINGRGGGGNNAYVRVSEDYSQNDDDDDDYSASSVTTKTNPTQLKGSVFGKYITITRSNNSNNSAGSRSINSCTSSNKASNDFEQFEMKKGGDEALTDKKIYIGMNDMNGINNGVNNIHYNCITNKNSFSPPSRGKQSSLLINNSSAKSFQNDDISSGAPNTWTSYKNESTAGAETTTTTTAAAATTTTTTSFIVAQNLIEKFDSCLNLAAQNLRNTLSPRISIYNSRSGGGGGGGPSDTNGSGGEGGGYCHHHTIEFNILKEDPSDTISYHHENENVEQVVFEKVKYDQNKRYLRHTPSNSSTGSTVSSPVIAKSPSLPYNGTLVSIDRMQSSSFSLDDSLLVEEEIFPINDLPPSNKAKCNGSSSGGGGTTISKMVVANGANSVNNNNINNNNANSRDTNGNFQFDDDNIGLQGHHRMNDDDNDDVDDVDDYEDDCKSHQYVSSLPNSRYFIQRDSNGNSYGSNKILFDDPWDMFDNKVNKARDKRLLLLQHDEYCFAVKGSPKSSSTTLETWVDDEIFDNSFNEELERHCIPIGKRFLEKMTNGDDNEITSISFQSQFSINR